MILSSNSSGDAFPEYGTTSSGNIVVINVSSSLYYWFDWKSNQ